MIRLSILCLALASCAAPVGRLNPGAPLPYLIASDRDMALALHGVPVSAGNIVLGLADGQRIMERHASGMPWVSSHECAHIADQRGISYRQAIALLTPPGTPNEHMAKRLASMERIADMGPDYWQNIKDTWGASAVQHESILARLK